MNKLFISLLLILMSCAVSKTKLTTDGRNVEIVSSKKSNCNVLDKVFGENENGSEEITKNHVRNLAGDLGANAVILDETVQNGKMIKIYGTALKCE